MRQDDKTQLWVAIGNQPGCSAWFNVWLVSRSKRAAPKAATKKLPQGACIA